jgi:flagellar motility protein MotE (MotC chaperone)
MSGGLIPGPVPTREGPAERVEQVKRLARVYEGMRAKEAASVIEKLERPLAARVLSEIKDRQAAKILGAMNPAAAADLTRLLGQPTSGETR